MDDALAVLGAGRFEGPARGRGPGVLVLAGPRTSPDAVAEACRRLADHGFAAWAPALEPADGAIPTEETVERLLRLDAVERLLRLDAVDGARLAVLGLGGGAPLALAASNARVGVALCLEPGETVEAPEVQRLESRVLLVVAEKDPAAGPDGLPALRDALDAAGARVELRVLPGVEPGFLDPRRADRYDASAARRAWDAALAVLRAEL